MDNKCKKKKKSFLIRPNLLKDTHTGCEVQCVRKIYGTLTILKDH